MVMTTRNRKHYPGVKWDRRRKAYAARLDVAGESVLLGYYPTEDAAHAARTRARNALARGGTPSPEIIPGHGRRKNARIT